MPVTDERTQRLLAARLAREQSAQRLPSLAAGLARQGALVWSGGRGRIDGARGPAPGPDVQYRAGSITKTFVAVAVLRLRDEGRLDLSDPIGRHLGASAAGAAEATIGQLMSHTSGLRAETAGPWWERTAGSSLESLAAASLGPDARRVRAGRWHHYSNVGYALLGELVARLRGRPWSDVIAAELLAPLGMSRTTARPEPPHALGFAVHPHADLLLPEPEHDAAVMAPAGQLWTTVADLARWAGFLAGIGPPALLDAAALAEMREPAGINDVAGQPWELGYGLGLQLWNEGGRRSYGHTGSMPGFIGIVRIDADTGDAAIALSNATAGLDGPGLAADLLRILAENEPAVGPEWTAAGVADQVLGLVGTWYWGPMAFLVSVSGEVLEFRVAGSRECAFRFRRDDHGGWTGLDGYFAGEPLRPLAGPDGRIVALDLASHVYTRVPYDDAAPVPGGVDAAGWRAKPPGGPRTTR
ncbi:MAG TPA: serine hydrolase domain-containing protein [Streptosporangiaceae bacterium]|nr:serine hydrolase domain-containing protein [Streptosporangiaceae bacterium]